MTDPMREALAEIESWKNDTLGVRPKDPAQYDCAPEIAQAFDRGARMAFYRCAERAKAVLAAQPPAPSNVLDCIKAGRYSNLPDLGDSKRPLIPNDTQLNITPAPLRGREEIAKKLYEHHCKRVGRSAPWTDSEKMEWLGFAEAILALPTVTQHERGRDWVNCPICGEPDMRKQIFDEGLALIHCTNHGCPSNGAPTAPVADRAAIVEECARVAEQVAAETGDGEGEIYIARKIADRIRHET